MNNFEAIIKQQEIIDKTIQTYKEQFLKAEKIFAERREKLLNSLIEAQQAEAANLALIGQGLEQIMKNSNIQP